MMGRIINILSLLFILSACVHEFPAPQDAPVTVNMIFDTDMHIYKEEVFKTKAENGTDLSDIYNIRYVLKAFPQRKSGTFYTTPSQTWIFTEDDFEDQNYQVKVELPEGVYKFMCWSDYYLEDEQNGLFYSVDDGFQIIRENTDYIGNNHMKDCYRGSTVVNVIRFGSKVEPVSGRIEMTRAISKFSIEATDLKDFYQKAAATKTELTGKKYYPQDINIEDYDVIFYYTGFKPNAYNLHTDRPCDSNTGYSFRSSIKLIEDGDNNPDNDKAYLGFDFCFANGTETTVNLAIGIEDKEGNEISLVKGINVHIQRGKHTIMRGRFMSQESYGGVAINPDFDGEFNIII